MNLCRSVIVFIAITLLASGALALDLPTKPTQWVNDYGTNTLSAAETLQLNEKLESLYKRTGVQFLVMIFPSLEGEDDSAYTKRVVDQWKVKDDKALAFFVFMRERKTRIRVGYSLQTLITDAFAYDILHSTVPPYFREGKYADGINAAVDRVATKIDPNAVFAESKPSPRRVVRSSPSEYVRSLLFVVVFLGIVIGIAVRIHNDSATARKRQAEVGQEAEERQRKEEAEADSRTQAEQEAKSAHSSNDPKVPPAHSNLPSDVVAAYETLELRVGASFAEVELAYRNLAKLYHPDKVQHLGPEFRTLAAVKMRNLNEASDRIRRYRAAQAGAA